MKNLNRRSKKTSVADAKQHYEKRTRDLGSENEAFKQEIEKLKNKVANVLSSPVTSIQDLEKDNPPRSNACQGKAMGMKSAPNIASQCSTKNHKRERAADNNEAQKLKAQNVKLQCKIKLDSIQFRLRKASLEKEILQLKKEQRKKDLEIQSLLALNRRQKLMLQRKKTETFASVKRLKQLLKSSKTSSHKTCAGLAKGINAKIQDAKCELEVTMKLHEVHSDYEHQMEGIAEEIKNFRVEADLLKADMVMEENTCSLLQDSQVDDTLINSELKQLKEEVARLSILFSQMEMSKLQLGESDKSQVDPVQYSVSDVSKSNSSNTDLLPSQNSRASPVEHSQGTVSTAKNTETKVCCSCSKRSSCKTPKCECRSAGGSCSASCGCAISKCTNREASIKSGKTIKSGNAEEQAAYPDSTGHHSRKTTETSDDNGPRKLPLHDIGNTLAKPYAGKAVRRKKERKPVAAAENADFDFSMPFK